MPYIGRVVFRFRSRLPVPTRFPPKGCREGPLRLAIGAIFAPPSPLAARRGPSPDFKNWVRAGGRALPRLDDREADVLALTARSGRLEELAPKYGISVPPVCQIRREIGGRVRREWGETAIEDATAEARWFRNDIRTGREKIAWPSRRERIMQEMIGQLVKQLGVQEAQAKGGAGLIMKLAKDQLGDDFGQVAKALPGAADLIKAAPAPDTTTKLVGGLSSMLGDKAGGVASLASGFGQLKLDASMVSRFLPVIMSFVQSKAGPQIAGLLQKVLSK